MFHTRSAPGVRPPEPFSSRAAVHRFQCLYPHGLRPARNSHTTEGQRSRMYLGNAPTPHDSAMCGLPGSPRLQGLAPRESPPPNGGGLDRRWHVALLGLSPYRVFSLAGMSAAFGRASPHVVLSSRTRTASTVPLQGLVSRRGRLVSLETADPPGVSRLVTVHTHSRRTRFGSHLLRTRGALPSPSVRP